MLDLKEEHSSKQAQEDGKNSTMKIHQSEEEINLNNNGDEEENYQEDNFEVGEQLDDEDNDDD